MWLPFIQLALKINDAPNAVQTYSKVPRSHCNVWSHLEKGQVSSYTSLTSSTVDSFSFDRYLSRTCNLKGRACFLSAIFVKKTLMKHANPVLSIASACGIQNSK